MTQHAFNIWNEGNLLTLFTDDRRCWKRYPTTRKYVSQLIVSLKTRIQKSFLHLHYTRHQLPLDCFSNCVAIVALDFNTPVSWVRRFSDLLGVCSSLAPYVTQLLLSEHSTLIFLFLEYYESRCSKFIHQIMNCLSAGNSFVTKFTSKCSPTLSSRCVFHIGVIQKYNGEPCPATLLTKCQLGTNGLWRW
jgi:hypothetical protein